MNVHDSWLQLQPTFDSPPVFISSMKTSLQAGHFVKVLKEGTALVGRILATSTDLNNIFEDERGPWVLDGVIGNGMDGFVKLNWFLPRELLRFSNAEVVPASSNLYLRDNVEVFQTKQYSWIRASDIMELCFVFKYVDVIDGKFIIEGMSNAFYARYRYVDEFTVEPISQEGDPYLAFPCYFASFSVHWCHCWSTEVWDSLIMMQQAITGVLCRYSQTQGKHPSGRCKISIPASVMYYISMWWKNRNVVASTKHVSQFGKHIRKGINYKKIKKIVVAWCWRFDTEYKLQVLSRLLGSNITVGIRRRPPKLGITYCVRQNDSLNIVVGSTVDGPDPTKKTDCHGIDFVYHAPYLDIYIRCSEFIVGGIDQPPTESLHDQLKVNQITPGQAWQRSIMTSSVALKVKQRFQCDDDVYRIEAIVGDEVQSKCVYGPSKGVIRVFAVDVVSRLMITNFTS